MYGFEGFCRSKVKISISAQTLLVGWLAGTACLTGDKDPPGIFQGAWKYPGSWNFPGAAKSSGPWKFPGP